MKRVLIGVTAAYVLFLSGRALVRSLADDETKIRRMVAEMAEAFDEGRAGGATAGLAASWRHEGSLVDEQNLRLGLFQMFRERRDGAGRQLIRVRIPDELLFVEVGEGTADLRVRLELLATRPGEDDWQVTWSIDVDAKVVDGDDGWEIVSSRHDELEGARPGRR